MRLRRLLNLLPLGLGLLLAVLINQSQLPNPLFRVLISLSSLIFFLGLLTSLFLLVAWLSRKTAERRNRQQIAQMQADTAEDRRQFLRRLDHELKNPLMAIRAGLANFANAPSIAFFTATMCVSLFLSCAGSNKSLTRIAVERPALSA